VPFGFIGFVHEAPPSLKPPVEAENDSTQKTPPTSILTLRLGVTTYAWELASS
jgi:hypothetical protein